MSDLLHSTPEPSAELPATRPGPLKSGRSRDLGETIARFALATVWSSRHPLEPFAAKPTAPAAERYYARAEDGWECPLYRRPPAPGASGEPVILAHGLGMGARSFDVQDESSLVNQLHAAGYDVYAFSHRGDRGTVAPPGARGFDFDDIVAGDVPAAIATARRVSGFERVLWVGHAMGGQLLVAHLGRGGGPEIAAAVTLCAAVRFPRPSSQARLAAMTARLLPAGWALPTRTVQRALSAWADADLWAPVARDLDGPTARGLLLHAGEDLPIGLVHQIARWLEAGTLCDRADRLDYLAAMQGRPVPLMAVAASGDSICSPAQARPVLDQRDPALSRWLCLGDGWGHLDPILGRQAATEVHPALLSWLEQWRRRCW